MTDTERDEALVAVQTKNVLLSAANTELLRQLTEAQRKAAALDWLEATLKMADIELHEQAGEYFYYAGDPGHSGLNLLAAIEEAMYAEKED